MKEVLKLKINSKFQIKLVNGHTVIYNCDDNIVCGTVEFNEIKMFLWEITKEKNHTKQEMLDSILKKFDISTVLALGEIDNFIKKLKGFGII